MKKKDIVKAKAIIKKMKSQYLSKYCPPKGEYDDVYYEGMAALDEQDITVKKLKDMTQAVNEMDSPELTKRFINCKKPKKPSIKQSFLVFFADFKAKLNK
jgi:hypothetical protein